MGRAHRFSLFVVCLMLGACAMPEPQCQSVEATLSAMVREQFLWMVLADPSVPVDLDTRERFTSVARIRVSGAKPVERNEATGTLRCSARIVFEAPRLDGGLSKRAEGELVYGVIRGRDGGFLVEVGFRDVSELAKRVARQFRPTLT